MYKALKDEKIIAINNTGIFDLLNCDSIVEDTEHTLDDYEQYNSEYVLKSELPNPTNEEQRAKRQQAFIDEADPLRYNYDEDCARYGYDSEEANNSREIWLEKKNEIRERYPYYES
ncbi:MAG: hypothetical protein J6T10_30280 [Methanobrevibacter sp.]|nr:hypothetical protein [Methanobrevibacter sp.]